MALQMDHYKRMERQGLDPKGSVQQERDVASGTPTKPIEDFIEDWTVEDIVEAEMKVKSAGNVGTGTVKPSVELVIEDTGHLHIGDESPSEALHIVTEGSVGIVPKKDWVPTAKLVVTDAEGNELLKVDETAEIKFEEKPVVAKKAKKKTSVKKKSTTKKKKTTKK